MAVKGKLFQFNKLIFILIVICHLNDETSCYPVLKVRPSVFGVAIGVALKEGANTVKNLLLMMPICNLFSTSVPLNYKTLLLLF